MSHLAGTTAKGAGLVGLALLTAVLVSCSSYHEITLSDLGGQAGPFPERLRPGVTLECQLLSGEVIVGEFLGCRTDSVLLLQDTGAVKLHANESHQVLIAASEIAYIYELRSYRKRAPIIAGIIVGATITPWVIMAVIFVMIQ